FKVVTIGGVERGRKVFQNACIGKGGSSVFHHPPRIRRIAAGKLERQLLRIVARRNRLEPHGYIGMRFLETLGDAVEHGKVRFIARPNGKAQFGSSKRRGHHSERKRGKGYAFESHLHDISSLGFIQSSVCPPTACQEQAMRSRAAAASPSRPRRRRGE